MTNCKNCGAPLHSAICEYCGTDYSREPEFRQHEGSGCSFEPMSKEAQCFANAVWPWEDHYEDSNLVITYKGPNENFFVAESFDQFPKSPEAKAGDCLFCRDCGIDRLYIFDGNDWKLLEMDGSHSG